MEYDPAFKLKNLLVEEILKFIEMVDSRATIQELEAKRDWIKGIFRLLSDKDKEEFLTLFGEDFLHQPITNFARNKFGERKK
ncbi:MAG TPA: hypothetical protein VKR32_14830 [Puia sp.]|nr:hypothetical protein [Puia sp.]